MLRVVFDGFWSEAFWLPPNTTWADLKPGPDKAITYPDYRHIFLTIPMALLFILLRKVLEKYVYAPIGRALGLKDRRNKKPSPNATLEAAYRANTLSKQLSVLAKQLDMSERQVSRWWRLRRSQDKQSTLVKFCEDLWRCSFFVFNVCFGIFTLWDKPWFWNIDYCYIGYPHHGITNDVWWYYIITTSYYTSLSLTLFWDVRRNDFWQMFVHHFSSVFMLFFSWMLNYQRFGTLVFLTHECSEVFLEAAKAAKHAGYQKVCDSVFAFFTILWIATRMGIYPYYILWSILFRMPTEFRGFLAKLIFDFLLCVLMSLNVIWSWVIIQVVYRSIKMGQIEADIRSCSEASDSSQLSDHNTLIEDSSKQELRRLYRGAART